MDKLKINASDLGAIMTNGRGKNAGMGETAKNKLREIWIKNEYNRRKVVHTKQMAKGNEVEEHSLSLYTHQTGSLVVKNEVRHENEWVKGYPDALTSKRVIEIKSSWDIWSFQKAEITKDNEWQVRAYMNLTGLEEAHLAYCLISAPPMMLADELYRLKWKFPEGEEDPEYELAAAQLEVNMRYDDIPKEKRIKIWTITRDLEKEAEMMTRIAEAREFYKTITL